jgi:hypothetical protein
MNDLLVPAFLGLSFGNLWLCALLVFSLQTTSRSTCAGYLVGRAATIVILAALVSLLGRVVAPGKGLLNGLSGAFLILFAGYLVATRILDWVPPWRRPRGQEKGCDGNCSACPTRHSHADLCRDCADDKMCAAEEPEVEPLTRLARRTRGRQVEGDGATGFVAGMTLGSLRGAALCGKLGVLTPLLLAAPVDRAMGMGLAFGVTSSVYPLLGFAFGSFALRLVRFKRWLFGASCLLLAGYGVHYLVAGLLS